MLTYFRKAADTNEENETVKDEKDGHEPLPALPEIKPDLPEAVYDPQPPDAIGNPSG